MFLSSVLSFCLNPYSTGSNSNDIGTGIGNGIIHVLILILLEVTQISKTASPKQQSSLGLNPYSTGSNSNPIVISLVEGLDSLNPYSTGSNSNNFNHGYEAGLKVS